MRVFSLAVTALIFYLLILPTLEGVVLVYTEIAEVLG